MGDVLTIETVFSDLVNLGVTIHGRTRDSVFSVHCPTIDRVLKHLWSKSGTRRIRGECK